MVTNRFIQNLVFFGFNQKESGFYEKHFLKVPKLLFKTKIFLTLT